MRLIKLFESHGYWYGWIDADGGYHEGSHGELIVQLFRDQIIRDLGGNPNDPESVRKTFRRVPDNDFYEYGFDAGWFRVYTEGGEIGFQGGLQPSREAIQKVYEIIKDRFDYKIMLQMGGQWGRFDDPKQALRWLNQRYRGVVTESIPETQWGYWIDRTGKIIPVGPHSHYQTRDVAEALFDGWIRVLAVPAHQVHRTQRGKPIFVMHFFSKVVTKAAIASAIRLTNSAGEFEDYALDVMTFKDKKRFDEMIAAGVDSKTFRDPRSLGWTRDKSQFINRLRRFLQPSLTEAPLGDFQVDPDLEKNLATQRRKWHGYERELQHYPDPDVKAIQNPAVVKKIATKFARIPQNINLYFWANPDPDYDWHTQKGEVKLDWIAHNMGKQVAQRFARMRDTRNRINIMHTGNLRDEHYVPMRSPWMMAHRIAHVLGQDHRIHNRFEQFVIDLTRKIYGVKWPDINGQYGEIFRRDYFSAYGKILGHLLGRMRSARQEKLVQFREWIYERFAQYLMTGRVRLNRTLPRQIDRGDNRMRPGAERLVPKLIGHFEHRIEQIFEKVLNDSIGKYYVM